MKVSIRNRKSPSSEKLTSLTVIPKQLLVKKNYIYCLCFNFPKIKYVGGIVLSPSQQTVHLKFAFRAFLLAEEPLVLAEEPLVFPLGKWF